MRNVSLLVSSILLSAVFLFTGCEGEAKPQNLAFKGSLTIGVTATGTNDIVLTCNKMAATWDFPDPAGPDWWGTITHIDGNPITLPVIGYVPTGTSVTLTYNSGGTSSTDPTDLALFPISITATVEKKVQTINPTIELDVNDPPVWGVIGSFGTLESSSYADSVAGFASDPDNNGIGVTAEQLRYSSGGSDNTRLGRVNLDTLNYDGDFTLNWNGTDGTGYFLVRASDGHLNGTLDPVKVWIGVNNTGDPSGADLTLFGYDQTDAGRPNRTVRVTLQGSDPQDPEGVYPLVYTNSLSTGADPRVLSFDEDTGEMEIEIDSAANISFTYTVSDGCKTSANANVTINVVGLTNFCDIYDGAGGTAGTGSLATMTTWAVFGDITDAGGFNYWKGINRSDHFATVGAFNTATGESLHAENALSVQQPPWDNVNVPYSTASASGSAAKIPDDEGPLHWVYINFFEIGKTEITNVMFLEFLNWMNDNGHLTADGGTTVNGGSVPSWCEYAGSTKNLFNMQESQTWQQGVRFVYDSDRDYFYLKGTNQELWTHPVTHVSWYGAMVFCEWLEELNAGTPYVYNLPTEAEWQFAAQGGVYTVPPFAGTSQERFVPWYDQDGNPPYQYWGEYRFGRWTTSNKLGDGVGGSLQYTQTYINAGTGNPLVLEPGSFYLWTTNRTPNIHAIGQFDPGNPTVGNIYDPDLDLTIGTIDYVNAYIDVTIDVPSTGAIFCKYFAYEEGYYDPFWWTAPTGNEKHYTKYVCNFADIVIEGEQPDWAWVIMDPNPGDYPLRNVGTLPVASFWAWPSPAWEPIPEFLVPYFLNNVYDAIGNVWEMCYEEYQPEYFKACHDAVGGITLPVMNPPDPAAGAGSATFPDPTEGDIRSQITPDGGGYYDYVILKGGDWAGSRYDERWVNREFGEGQDDPDEPTNYFDETYRGRTELWRTTDRGGNMQMRANEGFNNVGFRILKRQTYEVRPRF